MARLPEIEGVGGHGSKFRRFAVRGERYHKRRNPPEKKPNPTSSIWPMADPDKYYGFNRTILKGCELPEGVLPTNALETSPPPLKIKVHIELRILRGKISKIAKAKR